MTTGTMPAPATLTKKATEGAKKMVFTTGEAADVCRISQQTIIRCFDSGSLGGFRVPDSRFRRIPRANLIAFMRTKRIPLAFLQVFDGEPEPAFSIETLAVRIRLTEDTSSEDKLKRLKLSMERTFTGKIAVELLSDKTGLEVKAVYGALDDFLSDMRKIPVS